VHLYLVVRHETREKLPAAINIKSKRRPRTNYKSWKQNLSLTYLGSCEK